MMNRELMARQMFAKGGAAFPDLSGDGQVTQKDILMGRGVIPMSNGGIPPGDPEFASMDLTDEERLMREEMYRQREAERRMQEGLDRARREQEEMDRSYIQQFMDYIRGRPAFSPGDTDGGSVQDYAYGGQVNYMQEGGMAPMPAAPMAPDAAMPPMAQAAGIDQQALAQMLMQAQEGTQAVDDAESYEEVMNSMREAPATIEERREELAQYVGPEDAQQTPESVLTLVQPVMMMAQVDQGIGGLAQEQMGQPVSGDMAQGIMSTVDMGAEEGPAPVNFRYGGAVQRMANGGTPVIDPYLKDQFQQQRAFYGQLLDQDAQTRALKGQQDLTQAQMLFDLAQTGLAIAAPGPRTMSLAEKLAYAAQQTQLFPRIGERAAALEGFKQKQVEQQRQMDLAAAQGAMERSNLMFAESLKPVSEPVRVKVFNGQDQLIETIETPLTQGELASLRQEIAPFGGTISVEKISTKAAEAPKLEGFFNPQTGEYKDVLVGGPEYMTYVTQETPWQRSDAPKEDIVYLRNKETGDTKGYDRRTTQAKDLIKNDLYEEVQKPAPVKVDAEVFITPSGDTFTAIPGTLKYNVAVQRNYAKQGTVDAEKLREQARSRKQYYVADPNGITLNGRFYEQGTAPFLTQDQAAEIFDSNATALDDMSNIVTPKERFNKLGWTDEELAKLSPEDLRFVRGLPTITDEDYFRKFGMTKDAFFALPKNQQAVLLGLAPQYEFREFDDGETVKIQVYDKSTGNIVNPDLYSADKKSTATPKLMKVSYKDSKGKLIETVVDTNTREGQALIRKANQMNALKPDSASMEYIGTEVRTTKGMYVRDVEGLDDGVYLSYDGGRTIVLENGDVRVTPGNAFPVNDTITWQVHSDAKRIGQAKAALARLDEKFAERLQVPVLGKDGKPKLDANGQPVMEQLKREDILAVKNGLQAAKNGTGFWSNVFAAVDAVAGGVLAPETFADLFADTQESRQAVRLIRILGRSALSTSPRFAVAELETVQELFPNEATFFSNPETEAKKLIGLYDELENEEYRLQTLLSTSGVDSAVAAQSKQKIYEINRLKEILGPVRDVSMAASLKEVSRANESMRDIIDKQNTGD